MDNLISFQIRKEDENAFNNAEKAINNVLAPHMIALTKKQRSTIVKMNDGSIAFVEKGLHYAEAEANFGPRFLDAKEMRIDLEAYKFLNNFRKSLITLLQKLDDTRMVAGSEAYLAALNYYNSVKQAAKSNIPGAMAVAEDLKKQFERSGRSASDEPMEEDS